MYCRVSVGIMNKAGHNIVPCGTSYLMLPSSDYSSFTTTLTLLSVRFVLNQDNANPVIPRFSEPHRNV